MAEKNAAELKANITLGGDKEYKQALKGINDELKLAKSGMAAATSAFSDNDKSAEALKARMDGLRDVYDAQASKVQLMREELEKLQSTEGASADDINKLQTSLNYAEAQMNKTGRAMDALKADTEEEGAAAKKSGLMNDELKDKLKDVGAAAAKVSFEALAAGMAAVAAAAAAAVKELAGFASGVASYVDDLNTLSVQTGISTTTLQEWTYAANLIDVPVETMTGAMRKMTVAMGDAKDGSSSAQDKFKALGVSIYDSSGNLRDSESVFYDAITALGKVSNETERDALAMDLFGKSATDLNPLIEAGVDTLDKLGYEAHMTGYVLGDEMMENAQTYQDSLDRMNLAGEGLKNTLGAVVAPAFTDLADTATEAMTSLTTAIQDGLEPGELEEIFSGLVDEFSNTFDDIVDGANEFIPIVVELLGTLVGKLVEKLPEYLPTLLEAATGLLTTIMESLGKIDWLDLAKNLIDGLIEGLGSAVDAAISAVTGIFQRIWDAVLELFGIHSPSTVAAEAGGFILSGLVEGFEAAINGVIDIVKSIFGRIWDAIKSIFGFGKESEESKEAKSAGEDIMSGMAKGITDSEEDVKKTIKTTASRLIGQFNTEFGNKNGSSTKGKTIGKTVIKGLSKGLKETKEAKDAAGNAAKDAYNAASKWLNVIGDSSDKAEELGKYFAKGFANGITDNESRITSAARSAAQAAYDAAKDQLGIRSPSRVMAEVGNWYDEGFARGIEDSSKRVLDAVETLSNAAVEPAKSKVGMISEAVSDEPRRRREQNGGITINTNYSGPFTANDAGAFSQVLARSLRNAAVGGY